MLHMLLAWQAVLRIEQAQSGLDVRYACDEHLNLYFYKQLDKACYASRIPVIES